MPQENRYIRLGKLLEERDRSKTSRAESAGILIWPVTMELPMVPPSWNKVSRGHWTVRHRLVKAWAEALEVAVPAIKKGLVFQAVRDGRRIEVGITIRRKRLLDDDNAAYCAKPILDAMVRCGYLYDDNSKYLKLLPVIQLRARPEIGEAETTLISFQPCEEK